MDLTTMHPHCDSRWEFRTEDYDIGFGIRLRGDDGVETQIVTPRRVTSHVIPEDGSVICERTGVCEYCELLGPVMRVRRIQP